MTRERGAVNPLLSLPGNPRRRIIPLLRFVLHLKTRSSGCILWTGGKDSDEYGKFWVSYGRPAIGAHRVAYEMQFGTIPAGLQVDHVCRVPPCVNPDHLQLVTPGQNRRLVPLRRDNTTIKEREAMLAEGVAITIEDLARIRQSKKVPWEWFFVGPESDKTS